MKVDYYLETGAHESPEDGMCAMEWVAYLAGEAHSDTPRCVDIELGTLLVRLNDVLPGRERQQLRRWLPRTIGTNEDGLMMARRRAIRDWVHAELYLYVTRRPRTVDELGDQVYVGEVADRVAVGALPVGRLYDQLINELRRSIQKRTWDPAPVWRLLDALLPGELLDPEPVEDERLLPAEMAAALAAARA